MLSGTLLLLAYSCEWGLDGAAVAWNCVQCTSLMGMLVYVLWYNAQQDPAKRTWHGWSRECLTDWVVYVQVAVPSMVMIWLVRSAACSPFSLSYLCHVYLRSCIWYFWYLHVCGVGQNHTFIGIYGVHTVFLVRKSPCIRSYTVQMYNLGQPDIHASIIREL